jgi:hypothetical protein
MIIPGVPPLKIPVEFAENAIDRYSPNGLINRLRGNYWGVYQDKDGNSPFTGRYLTHEVNHTATVRVSTAPQEKGAFVSYSFTQSPNGVTVKLTKSGDKSKFLAECEAMVKSETLYYVLTPDATYNRNIESIDLVEIDIEFIEVRIIDQTVIKKTTSPNAAQKIDIGQNEAKTIEALF